MVKSMETSKPQEIENSDVDLAKSMEISRPQEIENSDIDVVKSMGTSKPLEIENSDRISSLHCSILYHIFSFLPTKYIIRATILSKRWYRLWESIPYLYFAESWRNSKSFMNFVDKVLLCRRKSKIIKFRLFCESSCDASHINEWISAAIRAGVEEIDLYTRFVDINSLPTLKNCKTLVALKLDFGRQVRLPESCEFPALKRVYLLKVTFSENFARQLMNSRNLEALFLGFCLVETNSVPSSPTLRGPFVDYRSSRTFPHLDHVFIDLDFCCSLSLTKFLTRFHDGNKVLSPWHECSQFLDFGRYWFDNFPTMLKMRRLELVIGLQDNDVRTIACLHKCSPVLESLVIKIFGFHPEQILPLPRNLQSIKSITMRRFCGKKNQVELLKFFLENELVSEKTKVIVKLDISNPVLLSQGRKGLSHLQQHGPVEIIKHGREEYLCFMKRT